MTAACSSSFQYHLLDEQLVAAGRAGAMRH